MTDYERKILDACTREFETAQWIGNGMLTRPPGKHLSPHLTRLTIRGELESDTNGKWHRWRLRR